jgi:hypothetical protein
MFFSLRIGRRVKDNKVVRDYAPAGKEMIGAETIYEGRLQSSWTHLITPSRNFVEVR